MHNLEQSIAEWRKNMKGADVEPEALDELEGHLRETVDQLVHLGAPEEEALQRAIGQLGSPQTVASEFEKLRMRMWFPAKMIVVAEIVVTILLTYLLMVLPKRADGVLLGAHVFTVTLGYTATLLLGFLGICFVGQHCWSGFSSRRVAALSGVTITFAGIALCFTAAGTVLGMIWAKPHLGRYWGWDAKEVGALCVLVWQTVFLFTHYFRWMTTSRLLVWSILGGNIVGYAWFGTALMIRLHTYGMPGYSALLLMAGVANFTFFLLGFTPEGWLRSHKQTYYE